MAKVTNYIPEPKPEYDVENQRQILESLNTLQQQLNFLSTRFKNEQMRLIISYHEYIL